MITTLLVRQLKLLEDIYNVEVKGCGRNPASASLDQDKRADSDNLMFGNMRP